MCGTSRETRTSVSKADPSIIDATILSLQPISLMRTLTRLALLLLAPLPAPLLGQAPPEGQSPGLETGKMWTFDNPPKEYWAKRYQFTPCGDWMNHVQLSALRYGNGCTASFVSGNEIGRAA